MKNKKIIIAGVIAVISVIIVANIPKKSKTENIIVENTTVSESVTTIPETEKSTETKKVTTTITSKTPEKANFNTPSPELVVPEGYDMDGMLGFVAPYGEYIEMEIINGVFYATTEMQTKSLEENLINLRDLILSYNFQEKYLNDVESIDYYAFDANNSVLLMSCVVPKKAIQNVLDGKYLNFDNFLSDLESKNINIQ